jgi:hypothetical protein
MQPSPDLTVFPFACHQRFQLRKNDKCVKETTRPLCSVPWTTLATLHELGDSTGGQESAFRGNLVNHVPRAPLSQKPLFFVNLLS